MILEQPPEGRICLQTHYHIGWTQGLSREMKVARVDFVKKNTKLKETVERNVGK